MTVIYRGILYDIANGSPEEMLQLKEKLAQTTRELVDCDRRCEILKDSHSDLLKERIEADNETGKPMRVN